MAAPQQAGGQEQPSNAAGPAQPSGGRAALVVTRPGQRALERELGVVALRGFGVLVEHDDLARRKCAFDYSSLGHKERGIATVERGGAGDRDTPVWSSRWLGTTRRRVAFDGPECTERRSGGVVTPPTMDAETSFDTSGSAGRMVRSTAVLGGGRLVAAAISALWLVVAARRLSVGAFGDLAVLLAIGSVVAVMSDLGYPFLLSHEVSRSGRIGPATLRFVMRQRLRIGVLAAAAGAGAYLLVASDRQPLVVVLLAVSLVSTVVYSSISAALRGLHIFSFEASNEVLSRGAVLIVGWALLAAGGGLVAAVGVYAAADFGSMVVLTAIARRHVTPGDDGIDVERLRFRHNRHLTAGRSLAVLYARADTWMMALLRGASDAALYGVPYRLLDGLLLVPRSIGAVAVPHLARKESRRSVKTIIVVSAGLAAVFSLPIAIFAGPLITTLFGHRYASSASTLSLLAASAIPGAAVMAALPVVGLRRPRPVARLLAAVLVVNVGLNLVAIPRYGPAGAAAVNLTTQLVLATLLYVLVRFDGQVMSSIR